MADKRTILSLTVAEVEAIETRSEVAFDQWRSPKASKAALFGSMLVELGGRDPDEVGKMTMTDLVTALRDVIDL